MSRDLTSALAAEFAKAHLLPVLFVEMQFVSGWVRVWSGIGAMSWNGETWLGIGLPNGEVLGAIGIATETANIQAQNVSLSLSGIPVSAVQQVINECRTAYPCNIYLGALDQTMQPIASPYLAWSGTTDVPTITKGGESCTVSITVENRMLDLQRARAWLYSDEDQQLLSPGDTGFRFVAQLQNVTVYWGSANPIGPLSGPLNPGAPGGEH